MGEALSLSPALCFCVAVSVPFILSLVLDKVAASHFFQSDGQTMDRQINGNRIPFPAIYLLMSTHIHKVWHPWSCLGQLLALPT
jgi:hypothetical protein